MDKELNEDARTKQDLLYECNSLESRLSNEIVKNEHLEQQCKKQREVIYKAIELLGNYKHYSTPDEKQNGDNEDLVNNAFDTLKEVPK